MDGIAQGAGTTSWNLNRDLGPDVLWYWHARATDGVTTSAYSATETFRTQSSCSYTISPTSLSINSTSATTTITVTTAEQLRVDRDHDLAVHHVISARVGIGSGSVFVGVSDNNGPSRTGTVTIAGQTFTVTQAGAVGLRVILQLFDPATSGGLADIRMPNPQRVARAGRADDVHASIDVVSTRDGRHRQLRVDGSVHLRTARRRRSQTGSSSTFSFTDPAD